MSEWKSMESCPLDRYILLCFEGPFFDKESPGVAVGKAIDREPGFWLTAIWAGTVPHNYVKPIAWADYPTPPEKGEG